MDRHDLPRRRELTKTFDVRDGLALIQACFGGMDVQQQARDAFVAVHSTSRTAPQLVTEATEQLKPLLTSCQALANP